MGKKKSLEQRAQEMEQRAKEYIARTGHPLKSRRDFLAAGLIKFSASLVLPSVLGALSNMPVARAQDNGGSQCPADDASALGLASLVTLNLSGGAGLSAIWVPKDAGGQVLENMRKLGLGRANNLINSPNFTQEFGGVDFYNHENIGFITGVRETAQSTTLQNSRFFAVPCRTNDDTAENQLSISGICGAGGLGGEKLSILGTRSSVTGDRNQFAIVRPPVPVGISRFSNLEAAVSGATAGALGRLTNDQQIKMLNLVKTLSDEQKTKLATLSGGQNLSTLFNCATDKNIEVLKGGGTSIDPRSVQGVADTWGINAGTNDNDPNLVFGSMVFNALNGNAVCASLEMGGFDYHGRDRALSTRSDRDAGQVVGRILETAAIMGRKVFIYLSTDGSVSAASSETPGAAFRGDSGANGLLFAFCYDPAGPPTLSKTQIGHFNRAAGVDTSFLTGGTPSLAAAAIAHNYFVFSGKAEASDLAMPGIFSTTDKDQITLFG